MPLVNAGSVASRGHPACCSWCCFSGHSTPVQDRAVGVLEGTHDALSVAYLTVHALHSVIVVVSCKRDLSNVNGAIHLFVGSELFEPCVPIRPQTISYENAGPRACSLLSHLE